MNRMRSFFYVCAGLFLLVLCYHLGTRTVEAQGNRAIAGFVMSQDVNGNNVYNVLTSSGDLYRQSYGRNGEFRVEHVANVWTNYDPNGNPIRR